MVETLISLVTLNKKHVTFGKKLFFFLPFGRCHAVKLLECTS